MNEKFVLLLLKKKKKVALSLAGPVSPRQRKIPWPFTTGCYMGGRSWHWCSVLGNPVWGLGSLLSGGSSHRHDVSSACHPWERAVPFCVPTHPTGRKVVSAHPWLEVSSSVSLCLFILGGCSPLYFYFQCVSGKRCEIYPPTLSPSYKYHPPPQELFI